MLDEAIDRIYADMAKAVTERQARIDAGCEPVTIGGTCSGCKWWALKPDMQYWGECKRQHATGVTHRLHRITQ